MKRSLRRMLRPGEKEPQSAVYQGVEDDMDDSRDSLKVLGALGGRSARAPKSGRGSALLHLGPLGSRLPKAQPGIGGRAAR